MRLILLITSIVIIGSAYLFFDGSYIHSPLSGSNDNLSNTIADRKEKYREWEKSVNQVTVTPIMANGVGAQEDKPPILPSDTILFLENFAVQQLGADAYYNVLKPRLRERERKTGENPNHHMMMFFIESKFNPDAQNWQNNRKSKGKHLVAVGLNQMTKIAIKDANQHGRLPRLASLQDYLSKDLNTQLDYAFQHYDLFRKRHPTVTLDTPFKIYAVTFYPKAAVTTKAIIATPNSIVAKQNPGYVLKSGTHKGYITKWSIKYYILKILINNSPEYHPDVHDHLSV